MKSALFIKLLLALAVAWLLGEAGGTASPLAADPADLVAALAAGVDLPARSAPPDAGQSQTGSAEPSGSGWHGDRFARPSGARSFLLAAPGPRLKEPELFVFSGQSPPEIPTSI
jgi:hypothetical protein